MEKSIIDMLSMEESAQDATSVALDPIDVFGEKSKNADEAIEIGIINFKSCTSIEVNTLIF